MVIIRRESPAFFSKKKKKLIKSFLKTKQTYAQGSTLCAFMKKNLSSADMSNMILSHILTGHKFIHFSEL